MKTESLEISKNTTRIKIESLEDIKDIGKYNAFIKQIAIDMKIPERMLGNKQEEKRAFDFNSRH